MIMRRVSHPLSGFWHLFILACSVPFLATSSNSAEIKNMAKPEDEIAMIVVDGEIVAGDDKKFKALAAIYDKAYVILMSPGGALEPALEIGKAVKLRDYRTLVGQTPCMSACAIIWLAGGKRIIDTGGLVGFHAAYVDDNGTPVTSSTANAIVGAYIANLGLSEQVAEYVTAARPDEMRWLTFSDAEALGLQVDFIRDDESAKDDYDKALTLLNSKEADSATALDLYWSSAQAGFAGAQNNYGDEFEVGEIVAKDREFAIYWYSRAAERGEPTAYYSLSSILSEGDRQSVVLIEALKFGLLAIKELPGEGNRKGAFSVVEGLKQRLSAEQIKIAESLVRTWKPLYQEKMILGDPCNGEC
jgi:hypothetical protein